MTRWSLGMLAYGTQVVSLLRVLLQRLHAAVTFCIPGEPPCDSGVRCSRVLAVSLAPSRAMRRPHQKHVLRFLNMSRRGTGEVRARLSR